MQNSYLFITSYCPLTLKFHFFCFRIKEHKHQADLAKLEDKREGEEIQRLSQLYQLELLRKMEKEREEKVERQRLYHVSNRKAEFKMFTLFWLSGVKQ